MLASLVKIPVMKPFKHPEIAKVMFGSEVFSKRDLAEMVKNTNYLIQEGKHVPGYRLTHSGKEDEDAGKALGWAEELELDERGLLASAGSKFTPRMKKLVDNGDVRWVSSCIKRDFKLTGEPDGPVLPGVYLDHIAVLGDELPAVKGLVDFSQVQLSEGDSLAAGEVHKFSVNDEGGEVCYFSATTDDLRRNIRMAQKSAEEKDLKDQVSELSENVDKLTQVVKKMATGDGEEDERAEFTEQVTEQVTEVQEAMKFGAEFAASLSEVGAAMYGNKKGHRAFKKLLGALQKVKFAPSKRLLGDEEGEGAELGEGAKLSEQDFIDAAGGDKDEQKTAKARSKISRVLSFRQQKNPKLTFMDLRREATK